IRFHDRVLGALHLADRRPAYFPLATIQFLESMMPLMGEAIQRFQTKAELARHRDRLEVLVQQRTRQLEAANARLDGIISSAMDAVISIDSKQRVVLFNEAAVKVFGMSASEALGQPLERFIPEQFRATHAHHVSQFGQTGATSRAMGRLATLSGLRANGQPFPIEASISKIEIQEEKQFTVVLRDITERKKAEEALQQATKELERSNADLQQFASVASHDLQEPIRAVAGYVKLLQLRVPDKLDAKAIEYITGAVDGAARMEKLISDLLTFSRIGTRDSDFGPADLNLVVSDALDNLRASINAARAKVTTDDLPTLPVNASQMTRLFQNLIGNALKFRGERLPEIHVGVQKQNGRCIISVRDNGIGIGPQHFDRIFQIFQRLHTRKSYPGTGIGLAVCKRIVERHGGTIWVESQPGEGSTFHLSLPQSRVG
ncbi:MAG: ATP-binding protein, partial [Verrucomicrobia bacterium]|nr:ATP-binding protein [Verrucomicrobiota bacterium]